MWSRQLELDLEVFNCECNRGAAADGSSSTTDDGNEVWVCDGAFAPPIVVDDPTMVAVDAPQDVVTTPTTSTTTTVSKEENDTAVDADVDVGVADEPTNSMGSSSAAAVNYFAVMAVGVVVFITTKATIF